ncbi:MAG: hypothetical protein PWR13_477 [Archaeoglobi archaeon]|nr:hypothetical protein [Archaeoglobi archaeon]
MERRIVYPLSAAVLSMILMLALIWSQFYPYIMEYYDLKEITPIALSASISASGMLIAQLIAGFIADRVGPKIPAVISAVGMLIAMLVISKMFEYTNWEIARLYWYAGSLIMGIGGGFFAGTYPAVIGRWYADQPGKAFGIVIFGQNLSPLITAPLAAYLIANYGLAYTFVVFGVLGFVLVVAVGVGIWKFPKEVPTISSESVNEPINLRGVFRDIRFWIMFAVMYSTAIGWFLILMNVGTIIVEGLSDKAGLSLDYVAGTIVPLFMMITAVGNALGAIFWGVINDRIGGPLRTLPIIYGIGGLAITAFYFSYTNVILLFAIGLLLYFALAGEPTVHFAAVPTFFGSSMVGRITVILNTSVSLSAIVGPYIGAFIRDQFGSYMWALFMAAALHFFATGVVLIGRKYVGGDESVQVRKPEGIRNRRS